MKPNFNVFYDGYRTLTYNALFNFIIGNRGSGKSFWAKYWAINDFIKTRKQFIYLRRFTQEIKTVKSFFKDLYEFFPDHKLEVKGNLLLVDGVTAGEAMVLSTSKIKKSNAYPEVDKIIFDEFILDKGVHHYLPNEVEYFLEFYETIARMREVRVFFLANAITQTNPYFLYFNIELPYQKLVQTFFNDGEGNFTKKRNKEKADLLIELVQNEHYISKKEETRFGQLIKGTQYFQYAVENTFLRDSKDFIEKKGEGANYRFGIQFKNFTLGIWLNLSKGYFIVSKDIDPSSKLMYSFTKSDHTVNTLLVSSIKTSILLNSFFNAFKEGNVRFENMDVKNVFYDLLSYCSIH